VYAIPLKKPSTSDTSRQADIVPLKDGIKALLKAYRLQGKLNEVFVVSSWERIMGKAVALKTQEIYISNSKLFVRLSSAPLKHELVMAKTRVMELINDEVGETVIKEVIFL
jgi:predicted nucleic acid-binding Zn ribbon protein